MTKTWLLVGAVLTLSSLLPAAEKKDRSSELQTAKHSEAAISSNSKRDDGLMQAPIQALNPNVDRILTYDYAKCIESCDKQYSDCAKGGNAERVKYCSNQHDQCRKACLEHK
jgi:hypothetical protein